MYSQIVVPVVPGGFSTRAVGPAARLAAKSDATLLLVSYARSDVHLEEHRQEVKALAAAIDQPNVATKVELADDVAAAIASEVGAEPGSLVCMSSVGRAHAGHVLGSVAEGVLRQVSTPVLLFGPSADADGFDLDGPITVCVDGSKTAETIVPIAASWAIVFGTGLRVISVQHQRGRDAAGAGVVDTGYVRNIARGLHADVGREVDYDVLHLSDPVKAIVDDADNHGSCVIAAATHGETGLRRMVAGSVTMGLVHRAHRPVLAYRPLQFLV
jgi:nucleotide-binding universal stress UspA family protein